MYDNFGHDAEQMGDMGGMGGFPGGMGGMGGMGGGKFTAGRNFKCNSQYSV